VGDVTLQLLQFLFGENLHEVVDVQQDPVQVDAVDRLREEADHPPQALNTHTQRERERETDRQTDSQLTDNGVRMRSWRRSLPS